jgi:VirE N-terminal domain
MSDAIKPLADAKVNLFANAYKPVPVATLTLTEAIQAIRAGRYQRHVREVRQVLAAESKHTYDKAKAKLPAFTFPGTFSPSRANEHLRQHSGIVHADMDHVENMAATKRAISGDPRTVYLFDSPSATSFKFGVHVPVVADDAGYKHSWQVVSTEYERLYGGQ